MAPRASDVLAAGTGLCYAKSHPAMALLRSDVPLVLCYQLLRDEDQLVLHGLVAAHLDGAWRRLDVRSNLPGGRPVSRRSDEFTGGSASFGPDLSVVA